MLTRTADQKILCVFIHVYQITKNRGPGPYNSLCHTDYRRYFLGLSLTQNRSTHILLDEGSGKIWTCSYWEKGNFIMISEFKYGQTWKILPSPLSLSLCSTFKALSRVLHLNLIVKEMDINENPPILIFLSDLPIRKTGRNGQLLMQF